jgi:hypothetical protein
VNIRSLMLLAHWQLLFNSHAKGKWLNETHC